MLAVMKTIFIFILTLLLLAGCERGFKSSVNISGAAQGTSYNITYLAGPYSNYRKQIDSIFRVIDLSLSTYEPGSIISRLNRNEPGVTIDEHFTRVFYRAMDISDKTKGMFDITIAPLVNAYGFGFKKKETVDEHLVDSLLKLVGYTKVRLSGNQLIKSAPGVQLDLNAIAQGYTVDVLAAFLESKGIENYLIELGGEIRANGKKLDESIWEVGIEQPDENPTDGRSLHAKISLKNRSLATSGNYKRFYEENGKKYTHILNPLTGYPAKNSLLSVTVTAEDCMTADAYATAFMVMGLDQSKRFLAEHQDLNLEVFFIYDELGTLKTYISENFEEHMNKIPQK
jgi:thiamine biosynthesis lipoprotein